MLLCPSCHCHVRPDEATCPVCAAAGSAAAQVMATIATSFAFENISTSEVGMSPISVNQNHVHRRGASRQAC